MGFVVDRLNTSASLYRIAPCLRASSNRIFINENLTLHRRNLVRTANERKEDGLLKGVWTVDGKIFVKTSPEGRPIQINSEDDLLLKCLGYYELLLGCHQYRNYKINEGSLKVV